jgi:hypothetical protein
LRDDITHRGRGNNLDRHVQLLHQRLNDDQLLRILLAEDGNIRLHHVEELRHNGGHSIKVAWSMGAFQDLTQRSGMNRHGLSDGVHLFDRWGEDDVCVQPGTQRNVCINSPWIRREVLTGTELSRIHKYGDHHDPGTLASMCNQRRVAFVQGAHGWHKSNARLGPL